MARVVGSANRSGGVLLLGAYVSLLVACGGGQLRGRSDGGDAGARDGGARDAPRPESDARSDARTDVSHQKPDAAVDADASADARPDRADATAPTMDGSVGVDAAHDAAVDAGPTCTLGTDVNCAACGDPVCPLANTMTTCTSVDGCAHSVCAAGFGNCKASSVDCETSFAAGGTCLPRYLGTTTFATDYVYTSQTAIGTDGSLFLVGTFRGTVDFDPTSAQDIHTAAGPADIAAFVTKLNADGSYVWTRSFPEPGVDFGRVAATAGGGVVIVGVFSGEIDLNPGPGVDMHVAGPAMFGQQTLILELDAQGSLVWGRTFQGQDTAPSPYSSPAAVAVDATGAVYVGGLFTGSVDFNPGAGTASRTADLSADAMLVKLTPSGDFAWVQTVDDGDCHAEFWGLAVATDGTVWGVGDTGSAASCAHMTSTQGVDEILIALYGQDGSERGIRRLPQLHSIASGSAVAAGANGSVYVAGVASGVVDVDPGQSTSLLWTGSSGLGGFVIKLAADASLLWGVALPSVTVKALAFTADGGVLAVGQADRAVVAKLSADGIPAWTFATGSPSGSADSVAVRGSTFVVAGSSFGSGGDFDPGAGTQILSGDIRFLSRFNF